MHCYVDMSSCCVRLLIVLPDIIATLNVHVTDLNEHAILLSLTKRCKKCTTGNNSKSPTVHDGNFKDYEAVLLEYLTIHPSLRCANHKLSSEKCFGRKRLKTLAQ